LEQDGRTFSAEHLTVRSQADERGGFCYRLGLKPKDNIEHILDRLSDIREELLGKGSQAADF
jgi:hypothetical protein